MSERDQALTVAVEDGRLVISIGIDTLMIAAQGGNDWVEGTEILDADAFAAEIADRLENEEQEDGTTDIHLAIDRAVLLAIENGSEAIRLPGDDEYD
ncbi:hypothetical protein FHS31_000860 [Sphingomonas vulcanisoli]|uniref:DUF1488 family protein n=1 Tax=Sphingomonas vulcanisoli TaxID=1658060 RepID=A0ABX0TSZ6_9SPHN|nr:hypothetical protein [Sphingomonas vulcanisoli]NIJ07264.1 hypothetical protein [Sphingomonas vulcanisoli]